jgi:multicomponent Na+:H+ antiporter subunit A
MSEGPASRSRQSSQVAGIAAVVTAAIAFAAVLGLWRRGGGGFDAAWLPSWDARLAFRLDGLGALYAVLATGVGVAVFAYATAYVPRHLEHEGRPQAEGRRFHALMVLFMMAMVGLSTAQDLLVLFVFWDLTAITSYYLIGFDRQHREARLSALMALLVTGVSAVLLLIGILIVRAELGTTSIPELLGRVGQGVPMLTLACALIAAGALAKSAQAPLHFWLPRAMAAPTPVSAYLHSAAMVAAGVFLLSRLHPLLATSPALLDGLLVVGLVSMAVGGLLALTVHGDHHHQAVGGEAQPECLGDQLRRWHPSSCHQGEPAGPHLLDRGRRYGRVQWAVRFRQWRAPVSVCDWSFTPTHGVVTVCRVHGATVPDTATGRPVPSWSSC